MTALQEIEAAIEKLTRLRDESDENQGTRSWEARGIIGRHRRADVVDDIHQVVAESLYTPDAALIVTLHRTIDAQLKILTGSAGLHAKYADVGREAEWIAAVERAGDLDLARAVNGGTE